MINDRTTLRRKLYAKLHIAKKQLGLDDETWRDLIEQSFKTRSLKELSDAQLAGLMEICNARGFKATQSGGRPLASGREHRKARALWLTLWNLGLLPEASEAALAGFARRVTGGNAEGVQALQWIHGEDAAALIEALKDRAARDGGVDWSPYRVGRNRVNHNPRARVVEAQRRILKSAGATCRFADVHKLPAFEADALIAEMGEAIRRIKGAGGLPR